MCFISEVPLLTPIVYSSLVYFFRIYLPWLCLGVGLNKEVECCGESSTQPELALKAAPSELRFFSRFPGADQAATLGPINGAEGIDTAIFMLNFQF